MNITIIYPHKRKTKSSTYGIAQMVLDRLLSGGTLHEFYLPQDMPHVCAGCYACMNGREDKCGGHEYMQKLIAAIDDSELIVFCAPTYVYHIPGQVKTLLDHFAYRWLVHRPDLSLMCKQALIITTAAGGGMKSTVRDLRDSMNYWGVGRTHVITQAVWGYDWSSMPENFMHKIEQKVEKTVSAIRKSAGNVTPCAKVKGLFYMYRLSGLDGVTHRAMMGEYILYYNGKIVGGIYDNRLLVKPVKAAISCLPDAPYEFPYNGAKPMLRVTKTDDAALLQKLLCAMYDELPAPKSKKKKQ